jgi:hypothetical protein
MLWQWPAIVASVEDKLLSYRLANTLQQALEAIRERFEIGHLLAGGEHIRKGCVAAAEFTDGGTISTGGHNVAGITNPATGKYSVAYTTPIAYANGTVLASVYAQETKIAISWGNATVNGVDLFVNSDGAAHDISGTEKISVLVLQ